MVSTKTCIAVSYQYLMWASLVFPADALAPIISSASGVLGQRILENKDRVGRFDKSSTLPQQDKVLLPLLEKEEIYAKYNMPPVSTVTLLSPEFESQDIQSAIKSRMRDLLKVNPWLTGTLGKMDDKKTAISYSPNVNVKDEHIGARVEVRHDMSSTFSALHNANNKAMSGEAYNSFAQACDSLCLRTGRDGKQPFLKVVLVPKPDASGDHWMILSMSHVIGDGDTYYSFFSMLLGAQPITPLQPERMHETMCAQQEAMGAKEEGIAHSAANVVACVRGRVASHFVGAFRKPIDHHIVRVDMSKIRSTKQQAISKKSFVSTNDILTSWFFTNSGCEHGFMHMNLRGKLENHSPNLAGNYNNCLYYRIPEDTQKPQHIRTSVQQLKRAVSHASPINGLQLAMQSQGSITNWASFTPQLSNMHFHMPIYAPSMGVPQTVVICVIYRETPGQLACLCLGAVEKIQRLRQATGPFLPNSETTKEEINPNFERVRGPSPILRWVWIMMRRVYHRRGFRQRSQHQFQKQ